MQAHDATSTKFINVTLDNEDFQIIKFAADGTLLVAATHDGRMIRFVKETDGSQLQPKYRGIKSADVSSISCHQVAKESPFWYVACVSNQSNNCHLFTINTEEGENTSKQSYLSKSLGYWTGKKWFDTEGSFGKFCIVSTSNQPKLCLLRTSGVYVLDDAIGTPKQYKGILPKFDPTLANVTVAVSSSGELMSEMLTS